MSQQLENALFELILEFMGGERNLRSRVAAIRGSLHGSYDSMRSATISGVSNLPERFRRSKEERTTQSANNILKESPAEQDKFRRLLHSIDPDMSEQEKAYLCSKSGEISKSIVESASRTDNAELKNAAIETFKQEISKHRETLKLCTEYIMGGDQALTKACNMDTAKKERFYHSIPGGDKLYERIKQAKFQGKDTSLLEKEMHLIIFNSFKEVVRANSTSEKLGHNTSSPEVSGRKI